MANPAPDPLETILRLVAAAAPEPWYPSLYAQAAGVPRDSLDAPLEKLRLSGLVHLTDWVQGQGQGYKLTPWGQKALQDPRELERARAGNLYKPRLEALEPQEGGPRVLRDPALRERTQAIRAALTDPSTQWVTWTLLAINILVFLYGLYLANLQGQDFLMSGNRQILDRTGALSPGELLPDPEHGRVHGQWWRLIACCFVHFGAIHLGVNMYSLYVVGPLLERMWGHWRYLILYLAAGLGGSCAAMLWPAFRDDDHVIIPQLAGASGALWGVMASMATWIFVNRAVLPPALIADWRRQLLFIFILNVGITFMIPEISKGAHFGGGIVGLLIAVPLHYQRYGSGWSSWLSLAGILLIPVLCVAALTEAMDTSSGWQIIRARQEMSVHNRERSFIVTERSQVEKIETAADQIFQQEAAPWLRKDPEFRRPDDPAVASAMAQLAEAQGQLTSAANFLDKAGPYRSREAEDARQAGRNYFAAKARLFGSARAYLKESRTDRRALNAEEDQVDHLRQRWQELLPKINEQTENGAADATEAGSKQ